MLQQRKQELLNKVNILVQQANRRYNITLPTIEVRFDLRGSVAGYGGYKMRLGQRHYFMRFNVDLMEHGDWNDMLNDTVPHELAHVICFFRGNDRGHGWNWRNTCIALGGSGRRCHDEEVVLARGNTYRYTTTTGQTVVVGDKHHQRIQQGATLNWRRGKGSVHSQCAFQLIGVNGQRIAPAAVRPAAVAPVVQPVVRPPVVQPVPRIVLQATDVLIGGGTKADRVRGRIRQAKTNNEAPDVVVQWAVLNLGMTRALASTYVKNNWNKV